MNIAILCLGIIFLVLGALGLWTYRDPVNQRNEDPLIGGIIFAFMGTFCLVLILMGV